MGSFPDQINTLIRVQTFCILLKKTQYLNNLQAALAMLVVKEVKYNLLSKAKILCAHLLLGNVAKIAKRMYFLLLPVSYSCMHSSTYAPFILPK